MNLAAFERCFLTARLLADEYSQPDMEFGMIGLSARDEPLHVLATPLLTEQRVTPVSVVQSGHAVLRMRSDIQALARRMGRPLVPTTFIHKHGASPTASTTDYEFLGGPLVDQVSTALVFEEFRRADDAWPHCGCADCELASREQVIDSRDSALRRVEFALAFSLIITRHYDYRLYAARKDRCVACKASQVRFVPAQLVLDATRPISDAERDAMARQLRREIEQKIEFEARSESMEGMA